MNRGAEFIQALLEVVTDSQMSASARQRWRRPLNRRSVLSFQVEIAATVSRPLGGKPIPPRRNWKWQVHQCLGRPCAGK
jgi:hypothetical protein